MNKIYVLARNTFLEIIRDRILYGLIVFALLLVCLSMALGQLSFTEQSRISVSFGFAGVQFSVVILSIFAGSTLVFQEIERQTILTILVRPISRWQFFLGKMLGLVALLVVVATGLSLVMAIIFTALQLPITEKFFLTVYGILLEGLVLLNFSLMFSTFSRPSMVISFSIGIFLIGHWLDNLAFIVSKTESEAFRSIGDWVTWCFPNLEVFNWRDEILYDSVISSKEVFFTSGYAILWSIVLMCVSILFFRRKEFV